MDSSSDKKMDGRDLREAESSAEKSGLSEASDGVISVREKEERAEGFYSGSGKPSVSKKKQGFRGKFMKRGPIVGVIVAVFGAGGILAGVQFFQPFSLLAQFQETFNSMQVSADARSERFFRAQMDSKRVKNPIKKSIFGTKFSISKKQASELNKQGIEFEEDFEGSGVKVLKYKDDTGEIRVVVANNSDIEKVNKSIANMGEAEVKYKPEAVEFKKFYANDAKFFSAYNKGSLTWRGQIANWFGTRTSTFLKNNKLTRNLFADYKNKANEAVESGGTRLTAALEMMNKGTEEIGGGGVRRNDVESSWSETDEIENGERVYERGSGEDRETMRSGGLLGIIKSIFGIRGGSDFNYSGQDETFDKFNRSEIGDVKSRLTSIAQKYSNNQMSGTASKVANYACLGVSVMGGISLLVQAAEAMQIIKLTTGYFEVFDKVKAGYGDDAPINELMGALNETKKNEHVTLVPNEGAMGSKEVTDNGISALKAETTYTEKTAMEASGIAALYGGGAVNANDPSVKSFNFTSNIKSIFGGLGTSMKAFEACAVARIAAAGAGAIGSGLKIAGCIAGIAGAAFTLGASATACGPLIASFGIGIGVSVAAGVLIAGIVATVTPVVANLLTRNLIMDIGGEDLGNALTSGANMYLGGTHRANGGSLSTREKYTQYAMEQQTVIAENARQERENLSPFDITSKYTFMGALATKLMSFAAVNSVMSAVTSSGNVVSSSLVALGPTASAYNIAETLPTAEEYEEICPYLASIDAVGDDFCNPYVVTDMSTMDLDPQYDVIDVLAEEGSFTDAGDEDTNVTIDQNSDLFKYIMLCNQRESAFGIADQNIANAVSPTGSLSNATNSAIGAVPIVGDIVDIFDNEKQLANIGYISGESCVAGNTVDASESPNWDKAKYYQRFIEDQSLAESMGVIEKSAVTVAVEDYYEKNPLDESYEGMLARYSGLEKDDVVALLDVIEYGSYLAQYDPSERYAFGEEQEVEGVEDEVEFDNENVLAGDVVLLERIAYADVRNRSFAV